MNFGGREYSAKQSGYETNNWNEKARAHVHWSANLAPVIAL